MRFRIDPIDANGKFDLNFFSSREYKIEGQILFDYLKDEGFDEKTEKFFIDFNGRKWEITPKKDKLK